MSASFDLSGATALVTGASRGLGRGFALALARAGADVVVTARNAEDLTGVCTDIRALGRRAVPLDLDVTREDSIRQMADRALSAVDTLSILVNNAGCNIRKPATALTWDDWNQVLDTNLRGAFFVARAIAPAMIARHYGRIINIGSLTCFFGYAGIAPYCASRGGIRQLTMSLADEWGPHGVTVNCLAPGWFHTRQTAPLFEDAEWTRALIERIPLKRTGDVEELDGALVFLASPASSYITGQTLVVDGGLAVGATRASAGAGSPSPAHPVPPRE